MSHQSHFPNYIVDGIYVYIYIYIYIYKLRIYTYKTYKNSLHNSSPEGDSHPNRRRFFEIERTRFGN